MNANKIIEIYAEAFDVAGTNTELLSLRRFLRRRLDIPPKVFSDLCAARMNALDIAEDLLHYAKDLPDAPLELIEYLNAKENNACAKCRYSSKSKDYHPECKIKIDRFFETREKLLEYGRKHV